MKRTDISGTLNIRTVSKSLNRVFLFWDSIEQDKTYIFPDSVKTFENHKICLCSFKNETKIIKTVNLDNIQEGKIIIEKWRELTEAYNKEFGKTECFFVLQMEKETQKYNYILCDASNPKDEFNYLVTNVLSQNLGLYTKKIEEYQNVFVLNPDEHTFEMKNQGIKVFRKDLYIKEIQCIDNQICLFFSNKSDVPPEELKGGQGVLIDENTGEVYNVWVHFNTSKREILFGEHLNSTLLDIYTRSGKIDKASVNIFLKRNEECICYELKNEQVFEKCLGRNKRKYSNCYVQLIKSKEHPLIIMPYYSADDRLHFLLKEHYEFFNKKKCEAKLKSIKLVGNSIKIRFRLNKTYFNFKLKSVSLILRSKIQNKSYPFALDIKDRGSYFYVTGVLPIETVEWEQFYWDIRGVVIKDNEEFELRLKNYSIIKRLQMLIGYRQKVLSNGNYVIFPYLTKSKDFAIMYRMCSKQDNVWFLLKEYLALFLFYVLYPYWKSKHLWLVYEKYSITAQDNSYYFFKYCMEKLDAKERKNIFYVIDKNAPDYQYVEQYGKKVIQFLSLKHMIYLKAADLLVSSDTKAHSYAWHSPNSIYRELIKYKRNAFLQHGVIYYKQCHQGLRENGTNACKLFIVSSEVEKQIIKQYFGYKENEIAVTGLARWDVLEDKSVPDEKMILMMPTWRNWLEEVTEEEFKCSDYFENYTQLLNNKDLHTFLEQQSVKLIFYIHPKFREYIGAFSTTSQYIEFVEFGSQPLNELIMKCNMMVTDYSSACWDVYYQGKPVLFYLFDYELYNEVQGSYIDMRTEAFGESTDNMDTLVELMKKYAENGFQEKERYAEMRETLLPYRDEMNSKRIYEILKKKFSDSK